MAVSQLGARRGRGEVNLGYGWVPDLPDRRDALAGAVEYLERKERVARVVDVSRLFV